MAWTNSFTRRRYPPLPPHRRVRLDTTQGTLTYSEVWRDGKPRIEDPRLDGSPLEWDRFEELRLLHAITAHHQGLSHDE